jgi:hypothetical protein
MHEVSDALVANWSTKDHIRRPSAVDIVCPHCARKVTYTLNWSGISDLIMNTASRCPACNGRSLFVIVDLSEIEGGGDKKGRLYIHPSPKIRYPIEGISDVDEFSEGLREAYGSAINVYNVGEWTAAAVLCRRLLEGITLALIPEDKRKESLYQQLQSLPEYRDLKSPIMMLADALRKGGNLGAHFDSEKTPNEETVTLMIDLLDYLLEYLFILPKRIESLHKTIDDLGKENAG